MTSTSDWFARKLGNQQRVPTPRETFTPQIQQPQHPQQIQQPGFPQPVQHTMGTPMLDPNQAKDAQYHIGDAIQVWGGNKSGGVMETKTTGNCPSCGSPHFFSRRNGLKRGHPPAPLCDSCGYNGLFEQFGAQN